MSSIRHVIRSYIVQRARILFLLLSATFIAFAVSDFSNLLLQEDSESWKDALTGTILTIASVASIRISIRVFQHGSDDQNYLLLDDDGLTYAFWGNRKHWSWQKLPRFQVTKNLLGRKIISFAVPDVADWVARLRLRPNVKVSSGPGGFPGVPGGGLRGLSPRRGPLGAE